MKREILIIDDDEQAIKHATDFIKLGEQNNHEVFVARSCQEGFKLLNSHCKNIDVILLGREMSKMTGIEFMKMHNEDNKFKHIPVIMHATSTNKEHVKEAYALGIFHYLVKPYSPTVLNSVIGSAIHFYTKQRELLTEIKDTQTLYQYIEKASFKIRSLEEADLTGMNIATLFPEPDKVMLGISELITNAIEHGNLGLTNQDKMNLQKQSKWYDEVKRRLEMPENKNKSVRVTYKRDDKQIILNIKDDGPGFDFKKVLEIDPTKDEESYGRGIVFAAKLSFDKIEYVGKGNEVICTVNLH